MVIVPRAKIASVTYETPASVYGAIFLLSGATPDVLIRTNDGQMYGVNRVPTWEARKLIRLLGKPQA